MTHEREPKWLQAARTAQDAPSRPAGAFDWLARALARAGVMPVAAAEAAIRAGRVTRSGATVREPFALVRPGEPVQLDGQPVSLDFETIALAFHKPAGAVTAPRDPLGRPTAFDLLLSALPPALARYGWHAVGRLDRGTTGLLLFTNDEKLVTHVTSPASHLPKRYLAKVSGQLDETRLEPLRRGVLLHDGPARPAQARIRGPDEVEVTLTEGRNHQVKRMLGAVGLPVLRLHREAVGGVELDAPEGGWRRLEGNEVRRALGFEPRGRGTSGDP